MTAPHPDRPYCTHSIVAHLPIAAAEPGTVMDAWACCDCGARFSRNYDLPTFQPEPSHLHLKLESASGQLNAALSRLRDAVEVMEAIADHSFCDLTKQQARECLARIGRAPE